MKFNVQICVKPDAKLYSKYDLTMETSVKRALYYALVCKQEPALVWLRNNTIFVENT